MVNHSPTHLNATFGALADPTRRAILQRLSQGSCPITELPNPSAVSLPAISKHLRVLEDAGLIAREREGRTCRCRLIATPLERASDWISANRRYWEQRLDALAAYLDDTHPQERSPWPPPHPTTSHSRSHGTSTLRSRRSSRPGRTPRR
ncbi:MAG: helix-turn-helix transcriptional regulator [Nitrospirae bacterium]|nr:helix-turn-helix transcriptional regulator [Nitrospirota bacterium]